MAHGGAPSGAGARLQFAISRLGSGSHLLPYMLAATE
jgi:hypothetical protein